MTNEPGGGGVVTEYTTNAVVHPLTRIPNSKRTSQRTFIWPIGTPAVSPDLPRFSCRKLTTYLDWRNLPISRCENQKRKYFIWHGSDRLRGRDGFVFCARFEGVSRVHSTRALAGYLVERREE